MNFKFYAKTAAAFVSAAVLASFASSAAAVGISKASLDIENYGGSGKPYSVLMTIPSSSDTRGFAWQTDSSATNCALVLESNGKKTVIEGETTVIKDPAISCHKAVASNLAPGRYKYEIKSGKTSECGEFTLKDPSGDTITIVNFSDAQTKDSKLLHVWENTCAVAAKTVGGAKNVDFIINCGDHEDRRFRNAQSNVFGFNVSGNPKFESLLSSANSNFGDILSGGDFGLEGGLGATIVLLVAILLALLMPTKKSELCPPVESPRTPKESE
jgi:hypothetical protein